MPLTNQILAPTPIARSHEVLPASSFDAAIDRTLVMVMGNEIGAHLTNEEKRAHLIDLKRQHLIDQVCVQEMRFNVHDGIPFCRTFAKPRGVRLVRVRQLMRKSCCG